MSFIYFFNWFALSSSPCKEGFFFVGLASAGCSSVGSAGVSFSSVSSLAGSSTSSAFSTSLIVESIDSFNSCWLSKYSSFSFSISFWIFAKDANGLASISASSFLRLLILSSSSL